MAGFLEKYVNPRFKYVLPATLLLGSLAFVMGYKMYYSRPAQKRKLQRNGEYAEQLWQMTHPQEEASSMKNSPQL